MYLQRFNKVVKGIKSQFPNSPWISTQQAEEFVNKHKKVLFIDARGKDEVKVSKIQNSVNIGVSSKLPEIKAKLLNSNINEDTKLISYCIIGK